MIRGAIIRKWVCQAAHGLCLCALIMSTAGANPGGARVVHGRAAFHVPGPGVLNITNTPNAIINWRNFSIRAGEITRFIQQSPSSAVLNRVVGVDPSQLLGLLASNGRVFLINPNGIVIGSGAVIDTAGFVASTLNITDENFLKGKLQFEGSPDSGAIVNRGFIKTRNNGDVYLLAPNIENSGVIESEGGRLLLAAGRKITISSLDGSGLHFEIQAPEDEVLNLGELIANGGAVEVFAGTLRHAGEVRADSLSVDEAGTVILSAIENLELASGSSVSASGAAGGSVRIESTAGTTWVDGMVEARGAAGASRCWVNAWRWSKDGSTRAAPAAAARSTSAAATRAPTRRLRMRCKR